MTEKQNQKILSRNNYGTTTPSREEIDSALFKGVQETIEWCSKLKIIPGWSFIPTTNFKRIKIGTSDIPYVSASDAEKLIILSERNFYAFDFLSYLAAMSIIALQTANLDLCPPVTIFGARVLAGELKRPTNSGRLRAADTFICLWQYLLCKFTEQKTSLKLTRNNEKGKSCKEDAYSACDAVAQAYTKAGYNTTYAKMKSICYDKSYNDIRELADHLGMLDFSRIE